VTGLFSAAFDGEGVPSAMAAARDGIDAVLRDRGLRRSAPEDTAGSLLMGAAATATLEGDTVDPETLAAGGGGATARAALGLSTELLGLVPIWRRSPLQALARLHSLAAAGSVGPDRLGRPGSAEGARRLQRLAGELEKASGTTPALAVAAIAHADIASGRPFGSHDGVVGRAVERLILVERGVDPAAVLVPEVPHRERAVTYREALTSYAAGGAGVEAWLLYASEAFTRAAEVSPVNQR